MHEGAIIASTELTYTFPTKGGGSVWGLGFRVFPIHCGPTPRIRRVPEFGHPGIQGVYEGSTRRSTRRREPLPVFCRTFAIA